MIENIKVKSAKTNLSAFEISKKAWKKKRNVKTKAKVKIQAFRLSMLMQQMLKDIICGIVLSPKKIS